MEAVAVGTSLVFNLRKTSPCSHTLGIGTNSRLVALMLPQLKRDINRAQVLKIKVCFILGHFGHSSGTL